MLLAVEFIDYYWHLLRWCSGHYKTKQTWKLSKGSYKTGWYEENNPTNSDYQQPLPLEAQVTSNPKTSPTTTSS